MKEQLFLCRPMKARELALLLCMACVGTTLAQTPSPPVVTGSATATPTPASATPAPPPSAPAQRSAAELEKLVMPIALHPDPLIAVILPAAVYPLEIVQAARFVKATNTIPTVDEQPWDENVKAVAKYPELIAMLDADLEWTMALGRAFLDQPKELMDTIQSLRGKAHTAGTLQTTPQQNVTVNNVVVVQTNLTQVVTVTNQIIQVQPSSPEVIYVPSYPPTVYYPPPGYVYSPYAPLVTFGVGMAWGAILANNCDWHHGSVDIDIDHNVNRNVNRNQNVNRGDRASSTGARSSQQKWQPDQSRLNKSGASASTQNREARGWSSGGTRPSTQPAAGGRPSTGAAGTRPSAGTAAARPSAGTTGSRPSAGPSAASRPSPSPSPSRSAPSRSVSGSSGGAGGSAFGGMGSGSSARGSSGRGATSRGGGGGRGGGGRR